MIKKLIFTILTLILSPFCRASSPKATIKSDEKDKMSTGGKVAVGAAATGAILTVASAVGTGLGFTPSGIAAGSIAAGLQAGVGNIAAGSFFALAQSLGAKCVIAATGGFGVAILAGVGIYYGVKKLMK